jgi:NMD protein affecting ribosome stability and mRNA decay
MSYIDDILDREKVNDDIFKIFDKSKKYTHCFLCGNIYDNRGHVQYNIPVTRDLGYSKSPVKLQMNYNIQDVVCKSCQRQYGLTYDDVIKVVRSKK